MTPSPITTLRERLGLNRAAFARAYRLPLRTVEDWEHGRRNPDGAAAALLHAIEREPDTMRRLLA